MFNYCQCLTLLNSYQFTELFQFTELMLTEDDQSTREDTGKFGIWGVIGNVKSL